MSDKDKGHIFRQDFNPALLDYKTLEYHIPLLESINVLQNSSIAIYDLYKMEHVYISAHYESIFGYNKSEFRDMKEHMLSVTHPGDIPVLFRSGNYFFELGLSLPLTKREMIKDFKYITDYRIRMKNGEYTRVLEQHRVLELDPLGNIWLVISIMDISPDPDLATPCRSKLINSRTGEYYNLPGSKKLQKLSSREKEILQMVSQGKASKQIADKLFISVHTVNTHRQRIIEKLNVTNTAAAIKYANELGLLG